MTQEMAQKKTVQCNILTQEKIIQAAVTPAQKKLSYNVVVIDDTDSEVLPLIRSLSMQDISVLYYKGRQTELPARPIAGIRIVFLDMQLEGMTGQGPETIASNLMHLLKVIISPENGPYIIFAWTKHDGLWTEFQKQLQIRGRDIPTPYVLLDMEKSSCKDGKGELDCAVISGKLQEKLKELPLFEFFTQWENIVIDSRSEVIGHISSLVKDGNIAKWTDDVGKILFQIAKAEVGIAAFKEGKENMTNAAMKVMSSMLTDCIEKRINTTTVDPLKSWKDEQIEETIAGIINTRIHVRTLQGNEHDRAIEPGNLYIFDEFAKAQPFFSYLPEGNDIVKEFFEPLSDLSQIKPCMLEITPVCDCDCGKWKAARLLLGLIAPVPLANKIKKHTAFLYSTPIITLDAAPQVVVFNVHYITSAKFDTLKDLKPKYQFRHELLYDIQHGFASHMSRRGIVRL